MAFDVQPCPKCGEPNRIDPELHPGTAFARCAACLHKGPEVFPGKFQMERDCLAAVVSAWNSQPRG